MDPELIAELANHDMSDRKEDLEMLGVRTFKDMARVDKETLRAVLFFNRVEIQHFESLRDICIDRIQAKNKKPQQAKGAHGPITGAHLSKPENTRASTPTGGAEAPTDTLYPLNQEETMMTETGLQLTAHTSYLESDTNSNHTNFNRPVELAPPHPAGADEPIAQAEAERPIIQVEAERPITQAEAQIRETLKVEECYAICPISKKKGIGLIIMNGRFEGQGESEEGKTLRSLFIKMGLEICIMTNRKREVIITEAERIASMNHCAYFLLAVGICTQCEEGDKLYANDGAYSFEKDLKPIFKPTNCPGLKGKPKIFFINSCNPVKEVCDDGLDNVTQSTEESDFLVVHSTVTRGKGFTSFNCCFIAHLEKTFEAHRGQYHLMEIIMIAGDKCEPVEAEGAGSKKYTQKCRRNSTLTKDVFIPK